MPKMKEKLIIKKGDDILVLSFLGQFLMVIILQKISFLEYEIIS
jgi:hypothetical protein